jgi:IMP dehydrogenase
LWSLHISDILKINQERRAQFKAARDSRFRLLCGAAISIIRDAQGRMDRKRKMSHIAALLDRGADVIAVSTAHGHSRDVGAAVKAIRDAFPKLPIIAGNVTSGAGVEFLAESGANIIKVGQGPGSICTTRIVAGVGIPQLTALYVASKTAEKRKVTILADGGINNQGYRKSFDSGSGRYLRRPVAGCHELPARLLRLEASCTNSIAVWEALLPCEPVPQADMVISKLTLLEKWRQKESRHLKKLLALWIMSFLS